MITFTGWSRAAVRFIDPPRLEWQPAPGAAEYRVQFAASVSAATVAVTSDSVFDFTGYWAALPLGDVSLVVEAIGSDGRVVGQTSVRRLVKAPDFDGNREPAADWAGSVQRNVAWLLRQPVADDGNPVIWCRSGVNLFGERDHDACYPALHHPSYINLFLAVQRSWPDTELGARAGELAHRTGDWLLEHTQPAHFHYGRFPVSTWLAGRPPSTVAEQHSITLFRAARVGQAMLGLYAQTSRSRYLEYAMFLARALAHAQRDDGSWPYRVRPDTGEVIEEYTSAAICVAEFLDDLQCTSGSSDFAEHIDSATRWTLTNPVVTRRWQGMYEDIPEQAPFDNLQNWDACVAVRFFCRYADRLPAAAKAAENINRFIEDQFVLFGPHESHYLPGQAVFPTVLEQYRCYWPMECHTGNWLLALAALHRSTGEHSYLDKAVRAANAITCLQLGDGRFSTWGVDWRFGTHFVPSRMDWYGCNAVASHALLLWDSHVRRHGLMPARCDRGVSCEFLS